MIAVCLGDRGWVLINRGLSTEAGIGGLIESNGVVACHF